MSGRLDAKRRNAAAYIMTEPTSVAVVPRERTPDGSGGWVWTDPAPLDPQVVRVITPGQTGVERHTVDGRAVSPTLFIMGSWDANIKSGYTFDLDGDPCEIVFVLPDIQHCVMAEAIKRG